MKIIVILLMFFVVGALFIISNNNLAMNNQENVSKFFELYIKWIDSVYFNMQMMFSGFFRMEWLPK